MPYFANWSAAISHKVVWSSSSGLFAVVPLEVAKELKEWLPVERQPSQRLECAAQIQGKIPGVKS
jgi:hypothetical protein